MRAEKTFLFQAVFDPLTRQTVPLHPYPKSVDPDSLVYAGRSADYCTCIAVCTNSNIVILT